MDEGARPTLRVGVVGCGRVGAVLGAGLRDAGHLVVAVSAVSDASVQRAEGLLPGVPIVSPDEVVRRADLILVTIPDDQIASVIRGFATLGLFDEPKIVAHVAGALGLEPLAPVTERGGLVFALHPAMTFSGEAKDIDRLVGTPCAVTGLAEGLAVGQSIVMDLGGEPFALPPGDRVTYHAALTHAANHTITLVTQAMQILRTVGVDDPERVLRPLMEASLDNVLQRGDRALTGPVSRGDVGTVVGHLEALERDAPQVAEAYRTMARATAERAIAGRRVPHEHVGALREALRDRTP
ncbi:Rossmann-like and DUF2520 domain-containing protein [Demetria terragena]|uniref:Rossmann-like and DUF2520 domain-containing protein n=1 Tax=Demetria terragena TaxID=63959 RepID=UPI00035D8B89|nr:DUF2520 domain-containing protein [Demetria terragena]